MQNSSILSVSERDRRYQLVRQAMRQRGSEALVVWGDSGKWDWKIANLHYLSQAGGNGEEGVLIFPLEGDPVLSLWSGKGPLAEEWQTYGSWITDVRPRAERKYSSTIVERLKELKLTKATVDVTGLGESERTPFPHGVYAALREALPKVRFQDASGMLEDIRAVKSAEEVSLMEKAVQIGESAIATLAEMLRPGVLENDVIGSMLKTMVSQGSELPIMFLWDAGRPVRALRTTFTRRRILQPGDVICTEFSPRFRGYCPQMNQPGVVGDMPKVYEKLYLAAMESYRSGWKALRPGMTVTELAQAFHEPVASAGFTWTSPYFHGLGMGNEGPVGNWPVEKSVADQVIREGMVLAFEPGAETPGGQEGLHIGDPVLVTAQGARRLGKRELCIA